MHHHRWPALTLRQCGSVRVDAFGLPGIAITCYHTGMQHILTLSTNPRFRPQPYLAPRTATSTAGAAEAEDVVKGQDGLLKGQRGLNKGQQDLLVGLQGLQTASTVLNGVLFAIAIYLFVC